MCPSLTEVQESADTPTTCAAHANAWVIAGRLAGRTRTLAEHLMVKERGMAETVEMEDTGTTTMAEMELVATMDVAPSAMPSMPDMLQRNVSLDVSNRRVPNV